MKTKIISLLLLSVFIHGCAGVVAGGAATGVAAAHDRRSVGTIIDDNSLEWKISQALYADNEPGTEGHINVTVYNNTILLSGEVPSEDLKLRANAIASNASDNKQVFNELSITTPSSLLARSEDTYITAKVKTALLDIKLPDFDITRVKVTTEANIVYLMGLVTQTEADAVTDKVRNTSGVARVIRLFEYINL